MEMAADDLPPHFGSWCEGKLGNNAAYVSFFPNAMHSTSGIAVNAAFWAINRARWANAMLASLGVREHPEIASEEESQAELEAWRKHRERQRMPLDQRKTSKDFPLKPSR
jgi:hypothetical protein